MSVKKFKLSPSDTKRFRYIQKELISWYKINRRKFSWRKKIRVPYEVLVCEFMGQQTQASRIEQFLPKFLKKFPTADVLASAKKSDVIKEWQGLGYNRRALNLQRTAIELAGKPFPKKEETLLSLPGVGAYTARAILIFAFNKPVAAVDVNIERVLSRLYKKMPSKETMLPTKEVYQIAEAILPAHDSRLWHEALMDIGATICLKRNPQCDKCPVAAHCKTQGAFINTLQTKSISTETKYFGYPKRIWRGKVLKIITNNKSVRKSVIVSLLQNAYPSPEFHAFIRSVLDGLTSEGFCQKKNNIYRLHQGQ